MKTETGQTNYKNKHPTDIQRIIFSSWILVRYNFFGVPEHLINILTYSGDRSSSQRSHWSGREFLLFILLLIETAIASVPVLAYAVAELK